jgi:hypothetical protein
MLAGPLCAAGRRPSGPQSVVCRFGRFEYSTFVHRLLPARFACEVDLVQARTVQTSCRSGGNVGNAFEDSQTSASSTCGNGHFSHVASARESKDMGGRRR